MPDKIPPEESASLIELDWRKAFAESDQMAVLERAHFVVPTFPFIYVQFATEGKV